MSNQPQAMFESSLVKRAIVDSFRKLNPRLQVKNPVMFVVFLCSILTTVLWIQTLVSKGEESPMFILWITVWLWFTVLFANFAEAMAEGRGKAQADALKSAKKDVPAKKLAAQGNRQDFATVSASDLRKGDFVLVDAGDFIPGDGDVVEGVATVDESAITGESAPVIR